MPSDDGRLAKTCRSLMRVVASGVIYNLACFSHGCSVGWVSGVLGEQALAGGAWLAALPCLIAIPSTPFFTHLASMKGRRVGACFVAVSFIISCVLATWGGFRGVWASRVVAGFGSAGALILAPMYNAEIAPRLKSLAALPVVFSSFGTHFAYFTGSLLAPKTMALTMAVPPTILLLSLLWLPETPHFLITIGKIQEAARTICWFKGSDFQEDQTESVERQEVIIRIRTNNSRNPFERDDVQFLTEEAQPPRNQLVEVGIKELLRNKNHRRALIICCIIVAASSVTGVIAFNSFAAAVLEHSEGAAGIPPLNETAYDTAIYDGSLPRASIEMSDLASFTCGISSITGAALATFAVNTLGYKKLIKWTILTMVTTLLIQGSSCDPRSHSWYYGHDLPPSKPDGNSTPFDNTTRILKVNDNVGFRARIENISVIVGTVDIHWRKGKREMTEEDPENPSLLFVPTVMISATVSAHNLGLGTVLHFLIPELFSNNVRSSASCLIMSWTWLNQFLVLRFFDWFAITLGLHNTYYTCAVLTFVSIFVLAFFVPEIRQRKPIPKECLHMLVTIQGPRPLPDNSMHTG